MEEITLKKSEFEDFKSQEEKEIDELYHLHANNLKRFARYVINKNLYALVFHIDDVELEILHAIKEAVKVKTEIIKKFSFKVILRKIFLRNLIMLHRHYLTNKHKVLTLSFNEPDYETLNGFSLNKEFSSATEFSNNFDYQVIMEKLSSRFSNQNIISVFQLYLEGKKPYEIIELTKLTKKQVYNYIATIKNYLKHNIRQEFFN